MATRNPQALRHLSLRNSAIPNELVECFHSCLFAQSKLIGKEIVCTQQLASQPQKWHDANMHMNIRKHRKTLGWTVEHLAEISGLSKGFLSQLENGKRKPSAETLSALSAALSIPVSALLQDNPEIAEITLLFEGLDAEGRQRAADYIRYLSAQAGSHGPVPSAPK
jgi:transcriptional regulator with XRE-family HTH domain